MGRIFVQSVDSTVQKHYSLANSAEKSNILSFQEIGCIGFLAIDSPHRGVFKQHWDSWIGAGVADTLCHPISHLFNIIEKSSSNGDINAK